MIGGTLGVALEVGVLLLLVVTLWRAARLERTLGALRGERGALIEAMQGFRQSADLAEQGVAKLRGLTEGAGRALGERVGAAGALQSDLAYMIERGTALADRLEKIVHAAREAAAAPDRPADNRERQMLRALGFGR